MPGSQFRFKQFTIRQDKSSLKVGTDAVLLGAWVDAMKAHQVLDIGTGSGVIAIMLAQKSHASIDAIDIHEDSCEEARSNASESPWGERIDVMHISLQDLSSSSTKKYDLIVSNPPYFEEGSGDGENAKAKAKHTSTLSYSDLIKGVKNLLAENGRFCVIMPLQEGNAFADMARAAGLHCVKRMRVLTLAGKPEKRKLMEFGFGMAECTDSELVVQDENHNYTQEYIELTKDYYLGLKQVAVQATSPGH